MTTHNAATLVSLIANIVNVGFGIVVLWRWKQWAPTPGWMLTAWTGGAAVSCAARLIDHNWVWAAVSAIGFAAAVAAIMYRRRAIARLIATEGWDR